MDNSESSFVAGPVVTTPADLPQQVSPSPVAFIEPNNPPWGSLVGLGTWLASVAFLFFVPVVTVLPYLVYRATTGATGGRPEVLMQDKNFIFFSVLGVIPAHLLTFALAWLIVTKAGRYPFWKTLGWEWPRNFGPWKSIAVAVALLGVGFLITYLVGGKKTELDELINSSYRTRVTTALLAATTGPLVEEVVYRGVLYSALQRALGVIAGIVIVSIMFAGVHVFQYRNNIGVIAVITLLSVTLTFVRAYTGRLLPSYIIHFVFNGIQSVLLVVQPFFEKSEQPSPEKAAAGLIAAMVRHFI